MFLFCRTTYWATMKALWIIYIHHSQKFWSILGGEVGVSFQLSKSFYSSPPPHPPPNWVLSNTCFTCLLAHNNGVHELANEPSHLRLAKTLLI
jgi:hypothetical protein